MHAACVKRKKKSTAKAKTNVFRHLEKKKVKKKRTCVLKKYRLKRKKVNNEAVFRHVDLSSVQSTQKKKKANKTHL